MWHAHVEYRVSIPGEHTEWLHGTITQDSHTEAYKRLQDDTEHRMIVLTEEISPLPLPPFLLPLSLPSLPLSPPLSFPPLSLPPSLALSSPLSLSTLFLTLAHVQVCLR